MDILDCYSSESNTKDYVIGSKIKEIKDQRSKTQDSKILRFVDLENRQKRFLRNLDAADFFHPLFAFFLLLK